MQRIAMLIATWFGCGLLPRMPGTWGSLAALPLAWAIVSWAGTPALLAAAAVVFVAGTWAAGLYARQTGLHDAPSVVVDEVVAQWLTLAVVPPSLGAYALGFILFRAADIAKPWPASMIDRRGHGAFSVMLDDVAAALYAAPALYLIHEFVIVPYAV